MLRVTDLSGGYRPELPVLQGINLDLADHRVVSILGSNGAGKSTLLRAVCGLLPHHSGTVQFEGERTDALPPHEIARRGVRMVLEGRGTFPTLTVRENLQMGGFGRDAATLRRCMERELARFPRLAERISQPAGMMSGGEQQMLAIARAMMADPKLLLLDEPSQGLAPIIVDLLFDLIAGLAQEGVRILLVEQDVGRGLEASEYAYVIEKGCVTREGASVDLASDNFVREAFLGAA
ncbi:MAG TPA: ABC transporter ATP-binding protein [Azospirillum sp.]|nr:ABC transporter ATP-binding protein [Azospirillum sp.]